MHCEFDIEPVYSTLEQISSLPCNGFSVRSKLCDIQGWIQSSSNVSKSAFVIYYPSCFIVYYEIELRKNVSYPADYIANPALLRQIRCVFVLHGYFREQRDNIRRHDRRKFVRRVWDWLGIWIFSQITQNLVRLGQKHSHCLTNYSNSVLIGYPGHKLPRELLTIVYTGKPLPESPFVCFCFDDSVEFIVDLLQRKIINYGSRRSRLSEGGRFLVRCKPP